MQLRQRMVLPGEKYEPRPDTLKSISDNEQKPCVVEGCGRGRWRFSKHCAKHCSRYRVWGHALAPSPLKLFWITEQLATARGILLLNREAPGVKAGLEFFRVTLDQAEAGIGPMRREVLRFFARLHIAKIDPLDCLTVCGAVWIVLYENSGKLIDERNATFNMANLVARLVAIKPKDRFTETIRRDMALYLQENLGILLVNIAHTALELAKRKAEMKAHMAKPLAMPGVEDIEELLHEPTSEAR